jgi:hypothetical protein
VSGAQPPEYWSQLSARIDALSTLARSDAASSSPNGVPETQRFGRSSSAFSRIASVSHRCSIDRPPNASPSLLETQSARFPEALAERYHLTRELGRGGMATVYLARDIKHARDVAVKVIHPALASASGSDRFLHEIRVVASLHHPHIVPLFDSGNVDGALYYVMPYETGPRCGSGCHWTARSRWTTR